MPEVSIISLVNSCTETYLNGAKVCVRCFWDTEESRPLRWDKGKYLLLFNLWYYFCGPLDKGFRLEAKGDDAEILPAFHIHITDGIVET